jgi:hypothetical protein
MQLTLRFGYDREFFRTSAVPLFPRRMDVPVHVEAQLPGAVAPAKGPTFALNDGVTGAVAAPDVTRESRAFAVLEVKTLHVASQPGDLVVPAPKLRYAYATRFEEDFVSGPVAKDYRDETVTGAPLKLRVLPLPEEGRPRGFDGSVGRFEVRAEVDRTSVDEGEIFRLTLAIEGEGVAKAPRLELGGFHVFGTTEEGGDRGLTVRYDIAAVGGAGEVPSIPFAFFDPEPPPRYRVARTPPILLEVRRREAAEEPRPEAAGPAGWPLVVAVVMALVAAAALAVWLRRRARPEAPAPDPRTLRLEEALAALRAQPTGPGRAETFAELLAAYLGHPAAAVVGPDLATRLQDAGIAPALASRAAMALERLVAARYGSGGSSADAEVEALLPELEAAFRLRPTRPGSPA